MTGPLPSLAPFHRPRFVAAGGGSFNPETDVSSAGIVFWLEAGSDCEVSTGTPASDTDTIEFWRDKSTNGNDFSQSSSGNRPTFQADGGAEYSNANVVSFSGGKYLDGPDLSSLTAGEIFALLDFDADPPADPQDGFLGFGSSAANTTRLFYSTGGLYDAFGRATRAINNATVSPDWTAPRIYNAISAPGDWSVALDGGSIGTNATNTVSFSSSPGIGRAEFATYSFKGRFRAVILYDGKLSTADRSAVYGYLDNLRA